MALLKELITTIFSRSKFEVEENHGVLNTHFKCGSHLYSAHLNLVSYA